MQATCSTPLDLVPDRRGRTKGHGKPAAPQNVRQPVPRFRQQKQGRLDAGVNASYAVCKATGLGNNSLGRVQTPVLAAVSNRYRERENHIGTDSWPVYISMYKENTLLKMRCTDEFHDRETAVQFYNDCKLAEQARITEVRRQTKEILPPELYNLTELQKDANRHCGLTAGQTHDIAQSLYEKKLISYPRTAGRHIPRTYTTRCPPSWKKCWHGRNSVLT